MRATTRSPCAKTALGAGKHCQSQRCARKFEKFTPAQHCRGGLFDEKSRTMRKNRASSSEHVCTRKRKGSCLKSNLSKRRKVLIVLYLTSFRSVFDTWMSFCWTSDSQVRNAHSQVPPMVCDREGFEVFKPHKAQFLDVPIELVRVTFLYLNANDLATVATTSRCGRLQAILISCCLILISESTVASTILTLGVKTQIHVHTKNQQFAQGARERASTSWIDDEKLAVHAREPVTRFQSHVRYVAMRCCPPMEVLN